MTPCGSRPRLRREQIFRVLPQPEPPQASPFPPQPPASPAREMAERLAPTAKQPRSSRALARRPPPQQPPSRPPQEERRPLELPQPPELLAKRSRRLPIPSEQEVDCSRPAPVMIALTASEANWWWVPRGLLLGEEVPQRAKQSPRALPIPSEWEARHSQPAPVMVPLMAPEADWWSVPHGPLMDGELPPRAKMRLEEPWVAARPEVLLRRLVQFQPERRIPVAKLPPAEPLEVPWR
jgi:hypothetical protein